VLSFTSTVETFLVEEIPAYLPSGAGEHTFLWIEKRDLTTSEAVRRVARICGVDARDVGYAGMKDRHATTRQWLSVPRYDPALALQIEIDGLAVLQAQRHANKLRTGHLHGNRFEAVLTGGTEDEMAPIAAGLARLARAGLPNRYGEQRFGAAGDNAALGLALLRGEQRERDHRKRRLLLSAAQSAVFNRYLELRAGDGDSANAADAANSIDELRRVRAGDVLQKTETHGLFVCEDPVIDQARVDAGELVPTGPMPGTRVMEPPPTSEAGALELRALAETGATREDFARGGRDLPGARRAVLAAVELGEPAVALEPANGGATAAVRIRFSLPSGSYATVLIDSLLRSARAPVAAHKLC
jgi:tRNA pseudouridine13 synthase